MKKSVNEIPTEILKEHKAFKLLQKRNAENKKPYWENVKYGNLNLQQSPLCFFTDVNDVKIYVSYGHPYNKNGYTAIIYDFGVWSLILKSKNVKDATIETLTKAKAFLQTQKDGI